MQNLNTKMGYNNFSYFKYAIFLITRTQKSIIFKNINSIEFVKNITYLKMTFFNLLLTSIIHLNLKFKGNSYLVCYN